jgi:hypothetical protein
MRERQRDYLIRRIAELDNEIADLESAGASASEQRTLEGLVELRERLIRVAKRLGVETPHHGT